MTFSAFKMLCKYYPKQSADSNGIAISLNDFFFFLTEIEKYILKFVWNLKRIAKKKKKDFEKEQNWRTHISGFQNLTTKLQ